MNQNELTDAVKLVQNKLEHSITVAKSEVADEVKWVQNDSTDGEKLTWDKGDGRFKLCVESKDRTESVMVIQQKGCPDFCSERDDEVRRTRLATNAPPCKEREEIYLICRTTRQKAEGSAW